MGELPVTTVVVHHDYKQLPALSKDIIPVQIYGLNGFGYNGISTIAASVKDKIKRIGVPLSPAAMDFLTMSLSVTAADTFVLRENAADGWTREITLKIPLCTPKPWFGIKTQLERVLHFLSGDLWKLEFTTGGFIPPKPLETRDNFRLARLKGLDCVCLFSGGMDSAIGAIDLLEEGKNPLLVSHAYKGDKSKQNAIATHLQGHFSKFELNAHPRLFEGKTDISMRTRSINFLSFATIGCHAIKSANNLDSVDLFIPENGFISLNAPLTSRRIGSLSTRTTHPYFLSMAQDIFKSIGIAANIVNPYKFKTKGEMIQSCKNPAILKKVIEHTVSCSHWKRLNQQCGSCVPCLIRRAAINSSSYREPNLYRFKKIKDILDNERAKDDLIALSCAVLQLKSLNIGKWIMDSGPLPMDHFKEFKSVFERGLKEAEKFLEGEGVL